MTLDNAIDRFRENPCAQTAKALMKTIQEYADAEMIDFNTIHTLNKEIIERYVNRPR